MKIVAPIIATLVAVACCVKCIPRKCNHKWVVTRSASSRWDTPDKECVKCGMLG